MERHGVVLSIHGEVTDPDVDVFDRKAVFIDRVLKRLAAAISQASGSSLNTSRQTMRPDFVGAIGGRIEATVTPQHLVINPRMRSSTAGLRPHAYCLPVAQAGEAPARTSPRKAATSRSLREYLPWHRQCAARARGEGERLRLRSRRLNAPFALSKAMRPFLRKRTRSTSWKAFPRSVNGPRFLRPSAQWRFDHAESRILVRTRRASDGWRDGHSASRRGDAALARGFLRLIRGGRSAAAPPEVSRPIAGVP